MAATLASSLVPTAGLATGRAATRVHASGRQQLAHGGLGSRRPEKGLSLKFPGRSGAHTPLLRPARAAESDSGDAPPGDNSYDPNDFAVSDEPVPDDILDTITITDDADEQPLDEEASAAATVAAAAAAAAAGAYSMPPPPPPPSPSQTHGSASVTDGPSEEELLRAEEEAREERRRYSLKLTLLDSLYGLERGIRASAEGRAEIAELVGQLEALNPVPAPTEAGELLAGRWVLVYTSFSELLPLLAASLIPLVRVGDIVQEIDADSATVINSVTFVGPITSTTIEASAAYEVRSPKRLQIKFQEGVISPPQAGDSGEISSSGLPTSIDLFGQTVDLRALGSALTPLQEAAKTVARSLSGLPPLKVPLGSAGAQSWLLTTYLDEDLRVSRGDGGGLFVLVKEDSPLRA